MKRWRGIQVVLWGILGVGVGLLLGWRAPLFFWPFGFVLVTVWLARWPKPGVWLLAVTFGLIFVSPVVQNLEQKPPTPNISEVSSTPQNAQTWAGVDTLSVRNSNGNISVTGGDRWRLRARYRYGAAVRGVPEDLLTARRGATLDFTGLEPTWVQKPLRGAEAQLRARVPRRLKLLVDARNGDVKAEDLASAQVNTNLGDVTLSRIAGAAVALTDVGNIVITGAGGGVEAETLMGDIWLEPELSTAPVLAKTDVGNIALVLPPNTNARITATSTTRQLPENFKRLSPTRGELVLGDGLRTIVLTTRIGEISVVQR